MRAYLRFSRKSLYNHLNLLYNNLNNNLYTRGHPAYARWFDVRRNFPMMRLNVSQKVITRPGQRIFKNTHKIWSSRFCLYYNILHLNEKNIHINQHYCYVCAAARRRHRMQHNWKNNIMSIKGKGNQTIFCI